MNIPKTKMLAAFAAPLIAAGMCFAASYDLVLSGGRVMDPASGLDARRNVGVSAGKISAISETELDGKIVIDVTGLVVAPGFIDLHQHGFKTGDLTLKVRDGVTTALEMEHGVLPVSGWYEFRKVSPVNFGAAVGHQRARLAAFRKGELFPHDVPVHGALASLGRAGANERAAMEQAIHAGLDEGALGVGLGIAYTPAADAHEIEAVFRVAAARRVPVFVHTRAFGLTAIKETVDIAKRAGVALHLLHVGSSAIGDLPAALALIDAERAGGRDFSTEVYPYTAASTMLEGAMFEPGWQRDLGIDYQDLAWSATGERLTRETFERYRKQGGRVIMHMMKEENVARAIAHPGVMIASDGGTFVDGKGHPRGAGTFARVLGHYCRELKTLSLMEALAKMTVLPARRLEHVPAMRSKGKIAVGTDADITVFNPATVGDRATFQMPATPSVGIPHVIVNGVLVVRDGNLVEGAMPGRPIRITN